MTDRRRPRRGPRRTAETETSGDLNPYRDAGDEGDTGAVSTAVDTPAPAPAGGGDDPADGPAPAAAKRGRRPAAPRGKRAAAAAEAAAATEGGDDAPAATAAPAPMTPAAPAAEQRNGDRPAAEPAAEYAVERAPERAPERPPEQQPPAQRGPGQRPGGQPPRNQPQGRHGGRRPQPQHGAPREPREPREPRDGPPSGREQPRDAAREERFREGGRRGRNRRRGRGRDERPVGPATGGSPAATAAPLPPMAADTEVVGWFDLARDGGALRRPGNSYLVDAADPVVPPALLKQHGLRRGDRVRAMAGRDHRGRVVVAEVVEVNGRTPAELDRRPEFGTLTASYPDRKLTLETGRPAKGGPELTRRAIDLIAPIGFGQRALIVAPARAGKTTLLHAITEGIAINHPEATLLILLVDERPEEVSEAISWGYGEVVSSSFDMPAQRHTQVAEMTLEHARRLVELGQDVVIVLDSITRLARAHNTTDRGTGRTMSGGLDTSAMAKPKAFFGSARAVAPMSGGGSLTIIATALVETGSRMDDVIFEEFKGTGNCEIKLDRSLAERRTFPAIDVATSGTRREDKLFRADQLDAVYMLRRGLQQMPPQAGMEWLIKRIAATATNDLLLSGL